MLCRCLRIAARRGGASASSGGAQQHQQLQQRLLVFQPQPIASLCYSTAAKNDDDPSNTTTTTSCSSNVLERRYPRGMLLPRQQQQQQRCMSAVSPMMSEGPEEEQKPKRQYRKERPREVIEEGIRELRVQLRPTNEQGSSGSRRVRRVGMTPGVVYGAYGKEGQGLGDRYFVKLDTTWANREIRRIQSSFENTVYELVVEGEAGKDGGAVVMEKVLAMPNGVRLHGVRRDLLNINFIRYKPGRKQPIPIRYINDDLNNNIQKKGAIVLRLKSHQDIILPDNPEEVPQWLDLDLENVRSGNKLRVKDIIVPPGIKLFRGDEQIWEEVICSIKGKKFIVGDDEKDDEGDDDKL